VSQGVAVCCSVLQCVAVCCSVLPSFASCRSVLQCGVVCCREALKSKIATAGDGKGDADLAEIEIGNEMDEPLEKRFTLYKTQQKRSMKHLEKKIDTKPGRKLIYDTARSVEDETRNAELNKYSKS